MRLFHATKRTAGRFAIWRLISIPITQAVATDYAITDFSTYLVVSVGQIEGPHCGTAVDVLL